MKKEDVGRKMTRIKLGEKAKHNFAYRVEDHKGNLLKEGGSKKGKASLNPVHKSKDNMVQEGKNEQEKN